MSTQLENSTTEDSINAFFKDWKALLDEGEDFFPGATMHLEHLIEDYSGPQKKYFEEKFTEYQNEENRILGTSKSGPTKINTLETSNSGPTKINTLGSSNSGPTKINTDYHDEELEVVSVGGRRRKHGQTKRRRRGQTKRRRRGGRSRRR